jgi:hypothetical protein
MKRREQITVLKRRGFSAMVENEVYTKAFSIFDGISIEITIYIPTAGNIETDIWVHASDYDDCDEELEDTNDQDIPFDGDVNICIDKARERIVAEFQDITRIVESNLRGVENVDGN